MAVYTNATDILRVQTQRSGGKPFAVEFVYGHPYVSTPNDERIVAAGSGGAGVIRAGIEQDNYILAPNSAASWFGFENNDVMEEANQGHIFPYLNAIISTSDSGSSLSWGLGQSPNIPTVSGETWNYSAYFANDGTWSAYSRLYVDLYDGASWVQAFDSWTGPLPMGTAYTRKSMTFTVPGGLTAPSLGPYVMMSRSDGTNAPAATVAKFSGVQMTKGPELREFFSGEWNGGTWRGVPNFSTSYWLV
jgi:hypothetical protein